MKLLAPGPTIKPAMSAINATVAATVAGIGKFWALNPISSVEKLWLAELMS
jgi:hypothetical protein